MNKIFVCLILALSTIYTQNLPRDFNISSDRLAKVVSPNPASNAIDDIVIAGDTIFVATARGVSISFDDGANWTNFDDEVEEFEDYQVSRIAYRNGVLWAGLWHYEDLPEGPIPTGGGMLYTTDFGDSWNHIEQPVDDSLDNTEMYGNNVIRALPITVPQQNMLYDIEITSDAVWIASWSAGIRKSTDMGQTWKRVVLPPDYLDEIHPEGTYDFDLSPSPRTDYEENLNHIGRSIVVVDDNTIYCGTAGGINKTTDGGLSWRKFNHTNQNNPISGNHIWAMKFDPYDNSIWACSWKAQGETEYDAISMSTDGGENWTIYMPDTEPSDFAFRYMDTGTSNESRDIIVATQDEGLFRSSDNGASWILAPAIFDSATGVELETRNMNAVEIRNEGFDAVMYVGTQRGLLRMYETDERWDGGWKIYFVSGEDVAEENKSFAFPNPFSPALREVNIKYSLNTNTEVTIRIFDFGMNLVRTVIQNAPRFASDEIIDRWDGRDEKGNYASNGVYFYRIDSGSDEPLYGKILVVK